MNIIYKGETLKYVDNFYGHQVLWITDPSQISMKHMQFVGGYANEYCIYLNDLSEEEKESILAQINK